MTLSIPIIFNHCQLISYWCLVFWLFLSQKNDDSDDEGLLDELELEEEDEDVVAVEQPIDGCSQDGDELKELRQRKDELTQRHLDQQRRKQQLRVYRIFFSSSLKTRWLTFSFQAILRERVQVELEVRPKLLVADTNCYIDHLDALMSLTREKHYTLVAPLVGTLYNRFAGGNTRKIWSWLSPRQKKKKEEEFARAWEIPWRFRATATLIQKIPLVDSGSWSWVEQKQQQNGEENKRNRNEKKKVSSFCGISSSIYLLCRGRRCFFFLPRSAAQVQKFQVQVQRRVGFHYHYDDDFLPPLGLVVAPRGRFFFFPFAQHNGESTQQTPSLSVSFVSRPSRRFSPPWDSTLASSNWGSVPSK